MLCLKCIGFHCEVPFLVLCYCICIQTWNIFTKTQYLTKIFTFSNVGKTKYYNTFFLFEKWIINIIGTMVNHKSVSCSTSATNFFLNFFCGLNSKHFYGFFHNGRTGKFTTKTKTELQTWWHNRLTHFTKTKEAYLIKQLWMKVMFRRQL